MDYFGIKTPQRGNEAPYIWWIANSQHEAWMSFFQYPSNKREMNAHRLPLAEAIQAYEAIGYRCVALNVQEKPNAELWGGAPTGAASHTTAGLERNGKDGEKNES